MPRRAKRARRGWLSSPRSAINRSGRLRGRPGLLGRPTATALSVRSRSVTAAGDAASRDCSQQRSPRHRPAPSTSSPSRVSSCRPWIPLVGGHEAAIRTAFIPPNLLLVIELGEKGPPQLEQHPRLLPVFEPAPAAETTDRFALPCSRWRAPPYGCDDGNWERSNPPRALGETGPLTEEVPTGCAGGGGCPKKLTPGVMPWIC
jgi:hypothetical protein